MIKKYYITIGILIIKATYLLGQSVLIGIIMDKKTSRPIELVRVYSPEINNAVFTDRDGMFIFQNINIEVGEVVSLQFEKKGYSESDKEVLKQIVIIKNQKRPYRFLMEPRQTASLESKKMDSILNILKYNTYEDPDMLRLKLTQTLQEKDMLINSIKRNVIQQPLWIERTSRFKQHISYSKIRHDTMSLNSILEPKKVGELTNLYVSVQEINEKSILEKNGFISMSIKGSATIRVVQIIEGISIFDYVKIGDTVQFEINFSEPFSLFNPDSIYVISTTSHINLVVHLKNLDKIFGKVIYREIPLEGVLIMIENKGYGIQTVTDLKGEYFLTIPKEMQSQIQEVKFFKEGFKTLIKRAFPQTNSPLNVIMEMD